MRHNMFADNTMYINKISVFIEDAIERRVNHVICGDGVQ